MPTPATALDTDTLKAALLSRGMLADRGRYTPFASDAGANTDGSVSGAPVSLQGAVAGKAAAGGVVVPPPAAANANDNKTALPISDDTLNKLGENDATKLLIGLGIGAAALTAYLVRRRAKLNNPAEDVPLVEGEDIGPAPKARATGDNIVNGEIVEQKAPITNTKRITQDVTVPDNEGMKALGAPKEVDIPRLSKQSDVTQTRMTAAQAIAARSKKVQPNDVAPIPLSDSMNDLTPDELNQAETLMEQLRRNRMSGNAANRNRLTGDRTLRSSAPTGSVDRDSLFQSVVRLIRQSRIKPQSLVRAIP